MIDVELLNEDELREVNALRKELNIKKANPFTRNANQSNPDQDSIRRCQLLDNLRQRSNALNHPTVPVKVVNQARENSFDIYHRGFKSIPPTPIHRTSRTPVRSLYQIPPIYARRSAIPLSQWRIEFKGDGSGLHDFLSQVSLLQRSESVSDSEMLYSIVHLLSGRAKPWFSSVGNQFQDWPEVVIAMKKEFLPANYDYVLLNDITNWEQKRNESFGEFITMSRTNSSLLRKTYSQNTQ